MPPDVVSLRAIRKSFPGVEALRSLDLDVRAGEVLALVGENGAGKSTLIRILSGVHPPDSGTMSFAGRLVVFRNPREAIEAGVATIHQELAYLPHLTVAENILLGERWPRRAWGGIDWRELYREARARLDEFEVRLDPRRPFGSLSNAEKQEVAMARALARRAPLLILDEPTASLGAPDAERLLDRLDRLRREGIGILYVSHRLEEVIAIADRIAVLRDGELVAIHEAASVGIDRLVRDMVGREAPRLARKERAPVEGKALLEVERITRRGMFDSVSFTVREGEILALAGLVGAGRSEILRAIYGLYAVDGGSFRLRGEPWMPRHPSDALARGIVYIPEERKRQALVLEHSLAESVSIGFSDLECSFGIVRRRRETERLAKALAGRSVRYVDSTQPVGTLSGGNQQKCVLARWLEREPDILLIDEPTRGVDVGAKAEIHGAIESLARSGKAVVLVSSDLPEVIGLADRVLVIREGQVAAEIHRDVLEPEAVLASATGVVIDKKQADTDRAHGRSEIET